MLSIKICIFFFGVMHATSYSELVTDETDNMKFTPDGPTLAPVSAGKIKETLEKTKIIPDALDKAPEHNANIMWYDFPMGFGSRTLIPYHVMYFPTWFQWPHDAYKLYTFVMTVFNSYMDTSLSFNKKAPLVVAFYEKKALLLVTVFIRKILTIQRKKTQMGREFLIWLIGNIGGDEAMAGKKCVDYVGWQESTKHDPDLHRYLVTIFEQPEKFPINFNETEYLKAEKAIQNRTAFSTRNFAAKYKLGDPFAVDLAFVNVSGPSD